MKFPLQHRLPPPGSETDSVVLDRFLDFVKEGGFELYPTQEEAILELFGGKNVILNTPTGSGKSMVATALHFRALSEQKCSVYTSPIKALVNEKFLALCREFGPEQVGMITGDASVNPNALILCCTAEILANQALRYGEHANISDVILDEFHYYSDRERGMAWQVPLLTLPQARFLLMSATLGDTLFFERELTRLNGRETVLIRSTDRPVPLDFHYSEIPLHETINRLITEGKAPIYLVNFTQRQCAENAQNFLSTDFCTKEEKKTLAAALENQQFSSPYGKEIQKLLRHGIGIHHAGILPKYRILVEKLAQKGLLKIICGTDTLGVGVNVPIRTVLFTQLCKFDGEKTSILSIRDFQQISGRAGRKGYDSRGFVVVQAPEHTIENLRQEQKAAGDPKKQKKWVKKKPPEKNFVSWNQETFKKLIQGQPEALTSRFKITHATLLNVLSRPSEAPPAVAQKYRCRAMRKLISDSHEPESGKKRHGRTAFQLFRSLVDRKIIELNPLRINVDLQEDFSLNHALSIYLIDTVQLLDRTHPDYALDLLTLVESILENPDAILRKQLNRVKTERMQELKLSGMDYEERIEELEKVEYPKPNRDFIYDTFNAFASAHPWVGQENIRPKSIAREMYETFQTFSEYVRDYELQRSEGLLLRYLSDVYKTLLQTIPDLDKTDEVYAIQEYLGTLVRQIDSSLIDEWERMKNPNWVAPEPTEVEPEGSPRRDADITSNTRLFMVLVRNEIFRFVRNLAAGSYSAALDGLVSLEGSSPEKWSVEKLDKIMEEYRLTEHVRIRTDTQARAPKNTHIRTLEDAQTWQIDQVLIDSDDHNDWAVQFHLDLKKSREILRPALILRSIGPI